MKINYPEPKRQPTFNNLFNGDLFMYEGFLYAKMTTCYDAENNLFYNAISIRDKYYLTENRCYFEEFTPIIPITEITLSV